MEALLKDTTVGYTLRWVFGTRILPHPDETDLPMVWQNAVHGKAATPEDTSVHTIVHEDSPVARSNASIRSAATVVGPPEVTPPEKLDSLEKGSDIMLVGWYGPTDPDNPHNWSSRKKVWVMFQTCMLTFSVYIGASIYTAGIAGVAEEFHVSLVAATVGLTLFAVGYGVGPMLWAPMSELPQIGRMPVYIFTLFMYVVLQVPTARATNYGMLMAFRFLTGFFGSPILATGGATVADMYAPKKRAYGITLWGVFAVSAPAMGPIVGGYVNRAKDWRWTMWTLMWICTLTLVVLVVFYPETSASNILYRRAARLRKATGNANLKAQSEIDAANMSMGDLALNVLVRPFTLNFLEPIVLVLNLYIGLIYAIFYIFFESFPIVFIGIYHFKTESLGLSFIGVFIGAFLVMPPFFAYIYYYQEPKHNADGDIKPEERLPVTVVGSILVPIVLFWFGWTSRESIHWIVPILASGLYIYIAALLLFNSVLNYLADAYPKYAASVLAGNDLIRSMFGGTFPLFATAMYHNLGVDWASSTLAFISITFIPTAVLLYKYGDRIRMASKRARHDYD